MPSNESGRDHKTEGDDSLQASEHSYGQLLPADVFSGRSAGKKHIGLRRRLSQRVRRSTLLPTEFKVG